MVDDNTLDTVYAPTTVEPGVYKLWEDTGAFDSTPSDETGARTFCIVIPPPNVTGALHLGHALNNTLQDILVRYHRMRGFDTLWQPGTDHAGIATQAVVERRLRAEEGKTRHELGREALVKRIWDWKDTYEARILTQLKLMGCSCDWSRTRFTLDDGLARAVRHQFFAMFKDGLITRGKRLVNWDTQLQTAVSDDEVYYETVKGHFWHFKYPVIDAKPGEPDHVIIATTRPETMLGDTAVAVHPDPEGFFAKLEARLRADLATASGKERDKDRGEIEAKLEALAARRGTHLDQLIRLRDMAADGRKLLLPLVEREIPLIADDWADPTKGSGCVKITPAHDPNDYEVGLRHDLPMISVLAPDGSVARIVEPGGGVNAHSGDYEGLRFSTEGRDKVIAELDARGLLHEVEDHEVEVGHSDRSKMPIEPFLSDQWFLRTGDVTEPRASARADSQQSIDSRESSAAATGHPPADVRPTPDLSRGATLLTWTTYGSWMPGDERGFVSRVPADGKEHEIHNLPGEPYDADEPSVCASALDRREGQPVALTHDHVKLILSTIAATCERHAIEPLAVAVMTNHVHILCQSERHGRELLQLLKGNLSRALSRAFKLVDAPRWWTKSGSRRRIRKGSDLSFAIEYVKNQKDALAIWTLDMDSGTVVEVWESARAEARGSEGLTLGDGSRAPGLAQAALDVVEDGRVQVFPPRYAKSYLDWLGEKRDWCISRQLWWGHRIPIWSYSATAGWGDEADDFLKKLKEWKDQGRVCEQRRTKASLGSGGWDELSDGTDLVNLCVRDADDEEIKSMFAKFGLPQDEDVLDTWFSSALWPFSTLGWPEKTEHLKHYYPSSVLCTSRDIITNWVARMVMFGLYSMGEVPFDRVYIHPKILDGRGETMSKSKGNGVDPVDIIETHGADALRYSMADMCTETQDIRMPVDYICPHCKKLTEQVAALKDEEQARKSRGEKLEQRLQPADLLRVKCHNADCGWEFATQWADASLKKELGVAKETSEKFEVGRNFCNKLWNAARFAFMNLEGAPCDRLDATELPPEDRWILARLSDTIRRYHAALANYEFSSSIKLLRVFFWESLCDWYIELTKPRMVSATDETGRAARQVLAFCMDQILRLFHPTIPFITEHLWQRLNTIVPRRGLPGIVDLQAGQPLVRSAFPPEDAYSALDDEEILATFAALQTATRAVRDLRTACTVPPRNKVMVTVVVPRERHEAFAAQAHILERMAGIGALKIVTEGKRPPNAGSVAVSGLRIFVHDISDDEAERKRTKKALDAVQKQIRGKESKLGNEKFVANAKPVVVEAERKRLADLVAQRESLLAHLNELGG